MRVSTVVLLTLSALAVQNAHQQATANPVSELPPEQLPSANATDRSSPIVGTYVETSPPEIVPDRQFAPTTLPSSSPTTDAAAATPSVTVPTVAATSSPAPSPATSPGSTPQVTVSKSATQTTLTEAIDIPVIPFQQPTVQQPTVQQPIMQSGDRPVAPMPTTLEPVMPTVQVQTRSQVAQTDDRPQPLPRRLSQRSDLPTVTVSQRSQSFPESYSSGIRQRRVSVNQLRIVRVTNRTATPILIELVGRTAPLRLNPGQTRNLQADPQDLSLLYWNPDVHAEFDARVSQPDRRVLVVDLFPSQFPIGSMGLYLPEPVSRPDIMRIF